MRQADFPRRGIHRGDACPQVIAVSGFVGQHGVCPQAFGQIGRNRDVSGLARCVPNRTGPPKVSASMCIPVVSPPREHHGALSQASPSGRRLLGPNTWFTAVKAAEITDSLHLEIENWMLSGQQVSRATSAEFRRKPPLSGDVRAAKHDLVAHLRREQAVKKVAGPGTYGIECGQMVR